MKAATALLAKAPVPGAVKTRMTPPLTPEEAATAARICLEMTIQRFGRDPGLPMTLFIDGELEGLMTRWIGHLGIPVRPQSGGDLGARVRTACTELLAAGAPRVIAIGSDSPSLPVDRLHEAVAALETHDAVIGPTEDGGYYLIGFARPVWGLLEDIPWSTTDVARVTLERAASIGARVAQLAPWYDVDDLETFRRALADIPIEYDGIRECGTFG